jgi:hypothetical protein
MSDIKEVISTITAYKNKYRRNDFPDFEISGIYDLSPSEKTEIIDIAYKWPDPWPHAFKKGIYLIFGNNMRLLYVGKASMKNDIGNRLNSYFRYTDDKKGCKIVHSGWKIQPRFVVTVAVPEGLAFEAPALEEYLISSLNTSQLENMKGILSKDE